MKATSSIFIALLILMSGCDIYKQDDYKERYVVESYLIAQRPLSTVKLSTTAPADEVYEFENEAVSNANVQVSLLDENHSVTETITYAQQAPGFYEPTTNHIVEPLGEYKLEITFPSSDDRIEAFTVIPDTFRTISTKRDTVIYQSSEQLEITATRSFYPSRQSIYVFNLLSLNPVESNLTPFYADAVSDNAEVEDFRSNSSGIINEENYEQNPDGTLTLRFPWLGVAFYEENLLITNAIDDNLHDFLRSQEVQLDGFTQSPGEIPNVLYNIEGGIGVFGSFATDTVGTFIKRPADF